MNNQDTRRTHTQRIPKKPFAPTCKIGNTALVALALELEIAGNGRSMGATNRSLRPP